MVEYQKSISTIGIRSGRYPSDSRSVDTDESYVDLYAVVEGRARPKPSTSSLHDDKLSDLEKRLEKIGDERRPATQRMRAQDQLSERTGKEIKRIDNRRRRPTDGNSNSHPTSATVNAAPPSLTSERFMAPSSNCQLGESTEHNELQRSARSSQRAPMLNRRSCSFSDFRHEALRSSERESSERLLSSSDRSLRSAVPPQSEKWFPETRRAAATAARVEGDQQRIRRSHPSSSINREGESQPDEIKHSRRSENTKCSIHRQNSRSSQQEPSSRNDAVVPVRVPRGSSRTMVPASDAATIKSKSTSAMDTSQRRAQLVKKSLSMETMGTCKPEGRPASSLFGRKSSKLPVEPAPSTKEQKKVLREKAYIDSLFQ
jgi:hypothetical protein